jgi:hypothetical protein
MFPIPRIRQLLPVVLGLLLVACVLLLAPWLQQGPAAGLPAAPLRALVVAFSAALLVDWLAVRPLHRLLLELAHPDDGWFEVHP